MPPNTQRFHFVNICNPAQNREPNTRKQVRRHIAKSNLHNILKKQSVNAVTNVETAEDTDPNVTLNTFKIQPDPCARQSLLCACFGKLEDVIALSKATGHLLCVGQCSECGRPKLSNSGFTDGANPIQQVLIAAQSGGDSPRRTCLGAGRGDPFASYALAMKPYMHGLLDNVLQAIVPQMFPVNTKYPTRTNAAGSFQLTISDPALLHATLAFSSFYFSASRGRGGVPKATIYHRGEAIRLMHAMFEDNERAISDVMIGCVVKLSSYEIFTGNFRGWTTHANASTEIVRRGGLQNLGLGGVMKRQVYETDIMGSMIGGSRPVFAPVSDNQPLYNSIKPVDMSMPLTSMSTCDIAVLLTTRFDSIASTGNLSAPLLRVLVRMHLLNKDLRAIEQSTSFSPEMLLFTTKRTFIEYPLLSVKGILPFTTPPTALSLEIGDLNEPIRLAALIYSNRVFRSFPPTSGVYTALIHQLKASLEQTRLSDCWIPHSDILLWVSFVAGVGTVTTKPIRTWFRTLLRRVCESMRVRSWDLCKWILNGFLWHEGRLEKAAMAFWEENVDCERIL